MNILAILSLTFGIIGFLSSFILGFGVVPSILAVILGIPPLIKKGLRKIAIIGMALGLLGVKISTPVVFLTLAGIIEKTGQYITQDEHRKPKKESTQGEAKPMEKVAQITEDKSIKTDINLGEGIRIGEIFIMFDSVLLSKTYIVNRYYRVTSKPGYKFVIVEVTGENKGNKRGVTIGDGKIEVDKGYIYNLKYGLLNFNLLPKEKDITKLVFEILESTTPAKLRIEMVHSATTYLLGGQQYTVDIARTEIVDNETTPIGSPAPFSETSNHHQKYISDYAFQPSSLWDSKGKESIKQTQTRDCESPDGYIVFKNVREGMCPEGYKEVIKYEKIR
jgi:hypothetical protein